MRNFLGLSFSPFIQRIKLMYVFFSLLKALFHELLLLAIARELGYVEGELLAARVTVICVLY